MKSEKNFSKGILDGWVKEYYESGLLKEEYFVKNGLKDGSHRVFYENGTLKHYRTILMVIKLIKLFDYDPNYHRLLQIQ